MKKKCRLIHKKIENPIESQSSKFAALDNTAKSASVIVFSKASVCGGIVIERRNAIENRIDVITTFALAA